MLCLANSTPSTLALTQPPPRWTVKGSIIMDMDKKSMQRRCIVASGEVHHLVRNLHSHDGTGHSALAGRAYEQPGSCAEAKVFTPDFPEYEYQELPHVLTRMKPNPTGSPHQCTTLRTSASMEDMVMVRMSQTVHPPGRNIFRLQASYQ
ncbi:hypothetical protein BU17DRAFT_62609 [Hysterangium stoloniferum]|nr:hypothetical protein BU17DRAFT_62609 [Hysterangium stoloniferum]